MEPITILPHDHVFVLTGAGISAESGLRTFRDAGGLWEEHPVEEVASLSGWLHNPGLVWRFYSDRRLQAMTAQPNAAHVALARLEQALGDRLFLCTQNVDPLHERAGALRVCHMHGELTKSRCERCAAPPFVDERQIRDEASIPRCACGARIRPHICWFGEIPFEMDRIGAALDCCTLFVTVGSSGAVYPAAGFVAHVRQRPRPARTIYVGLEEPENGFFFDEQRLGKAAAMLPTLFRLTESP